jgi:hypothetical protein
MNGDRAGEQFERANHLWFREGRTAAAVSAYEEARRAAPADPVVAFQLSRVLWALDRFDEARELAALAEERREELGDAGRRVLDAWRERLAAPPPARLFPELPPGRLDRDWLDAGPLPDGGWREVADAAAARGMYGLAAYAVERWGGVPLDADDMREIGQIATNRHLDEAVLARMRGRGADAGADADADVDVDADVDAEPFASSSASPAASPAASSTAASSTVGPSALARTLPLTLSARVTPVAGRAGVETELIVSLRNTTGAAQIVNERLLLNHEGAPGEIWLDVDGPAAYRNTRGFRVRAGAAANEHFISLAADHAIERAWTLTEYESLDQPGDYRVTVTYHNEATHAPDGRPLAIGQTTAIARFRRYP